MTNALALLELPSSSKMLRLETKELLKQWLPEILSPSDHCPSFSVLTGGAKQPSLSRPCRAGSCSAPLKELLSLTMQSQLSEITCLKTLPFSLFLECPSQSSFTTPTSLPSRTQAKTHLLLTCHRVLQVFSVFKICHIALLLLLTITRISDTIYSMLFARYYLIYTLSY